MATTSPSMPPMPGPNVPFMLSNGTINPTWYEWLTIVAAIVKQLREEV